jgi:hypothetical protein
MVENDRHRRTYETDKSRKALLLYERINDMLSDRNSEVKVKRDKTGNLKVLLLQCEDSVTIE